jgi:hypothetical protein
MWYESTLLRRSLLLSVIVMTALLATWAFAAWRGREEAS